MPAHLQACIIPKNNCTNVPFAVENVDVHCNGICMVLTPCKLLSVLLQALILELSAMAAIRQVKYLESVIFWKRTDLFNLESAVLDGFAIFLEIPAEVLNVVRRLALFSKEPLQTMFDLVKSTISVKKYRTE